MRLDPTDRLRHFTKRLIWLVVSAEKFDLLNRKDYKKLVFIAKNEVNSNTNQWFAFVASRASRLAAVEKAKSDLLRARDLSDRRARILR